MTIVLWNGNHYDAGTPQQAEWARGFECPVHGDIPYGAIMTTKCCIVCRSMLIRRAH